MFPEEVSNLQQPLVGSRYTVKALKHRCLNFSQKITNNIPSNNLPLQPTCS